MLPLWEHGGHHLRSAVLIFTMITAVVSLIAISISFARDKRGVNLDA